MGTKKYCCNSGNNATVGILCCNSSNRPLLEHILATVGTEIIVVAHCYSSGNWGDIRTMTLDAICYLCYSFCVRVVWVHSSFVLWVSVQQPPDVTTCIIMVWRTPVKFKCAPKTVPSKSCLLHGSELFTPTGRGREKEGGGRIRKSNRANCQVIAYLVYKLLSILKTFDSSSLWGQKPLTNSLYCMPWTGSALIKLYSCLVIPDKC